MNLPEHYQNQVYFQEQMKHISIPGIIAKTWFLYYVLGDNSNITQNLFASFWTVSSFYVEWSLVTGACAFR